MKPFSLLVKPASADCNLHCAYCFYLKKAALYPQSAPHRMSDAVLERMVRSYLETEQPVYAFGWQGGEPTLMGLDFFERVTSLQETAGRAGAVVSNGLQTNGVLINDDLARHLGAYKFLLGVSLDGPAEIHDHYRRDGSGKETHAGVLRGIAALKRNHVEFNILTLVSQANVGKAQQVYRYLRDAGFLFHQYIECVEFEPDGTFKPFAVGGEAWGEFLCGIYDEWRKSDVRKVSVRLFDSILALLVDGTANVCHMAGDCRQYLVVEHNGDVYPCDFHVEPALRLGNVMQDSWDSMLASPAYAAFGARKRERNEACAECEYQRLCAGDCPKNRPNGAPATRPLSALCAGWKLFYAHALPGLNDIAEQIKKERTRRREPAADGHIPGRNDPCPCGAVDANGRQVKYKRCCGRG